MNGCPCSCLCSFLLYATLLLIADAAFALSLEDMEGKKKSALCMIDSSNSGL